MAQFYTLDEAAQRLGMPTDEFKRKTKTEWTSLRPFRDGATLRYRAADIDELARSLGAASDPGLPLGAPGKPLGDSSEELAFTDDSPIDFGPDSGGSEDIFTLAPAAGGSKDRLKPPGDSDVRLDLNPPDKDKGSGRRPTGDIALDAGGSPSSARLTAPKSGPKLSGRVPSPAPPADSDSSSEFELRLDADSDSFDLQLAGDSEDVDLGAAPKPKKGPQSGINLNRPADSGVSLEKKRKPPADDASDMDFELSLDAPGPQSGQLGPRTGPLARATGVDSSSEFELTLDDSSGSAESLAADVRDENKGDIFETDFDLPAVDESGSEVVAVEADTDLDSGFEVDVADDGSDVVAMDDDAAVLVDEDDDGPAAARALRGVSRDDDDEDFRGAATRTVVAAPPSWGPLPAAVLLPSLVFLFLGSIMSYEALRGMWGYHQPSQPANGLIRGVAETVAGKVAD